MIYSIPPNVRLEYLAGRPLISTAQDGKVVLDKVLVELWKQANGKSQAEITATFRMKYANALTVAGGLACLAEGGLLTRDYAPGEQPEEEKRPEPPVPLANISAVIVAFNGRKWLPACLESLNRQSLRLAEIIVVDNGSSDGTAEWLAQNYPDVHVLGLETGISFAAALNRGIAAAKGDYFLALNQDVTLDPQATAGLVNAAAPNCAAVAACLRLMWAPAFLNGLGNQARIAGWGSDNFIGALDLGQFGEISRAPSACLAAALIVRDAWLKVGPLDEGFPMYYEDTEWCYRAREMGFEIAAAPHAVVYHAFGGGAAAGQSGMSNLRLENVVYGRLRFHSKLYAGWQRVGRILACMVQDLAGMVGAVLRLRLDLAQAAWRGWQKWLAHPPASLKADPERRPAFQTKWKGIPYPRMWRGLPELTWEMVCCETLPLMVAGKTRRLPEMETLPVAEKKMVSWGWKKRLALQLEGEGVKAILRNLRRQVL